MVMFVRMVMSDRVLSTVSGPLDFKFLQAFHSLSPIIVHKNMFDAKSSSNLSEVMVSAQEEGYYRIQSGVKQGFMV